MVSTFESLAASPLARGTLSMAAKVDPGATSLDANRTSVLRV
jgi:hypothetical protein